MKKFIIGFVLGSLLVGASGAWAKTRGEFIEVFYSVKGIKVDNRSLEMKERPFVYKGYTYVPLRTMLDILGHHRVTWNEQTAEINITSPIILHNSLLLLPEDAKVEGIMVTAEGAPEETLPAYVIARGKSKITISVSGIVTGLEIDPEDRDPFAFLGDAIKGYYSIPDPNKPETER